MATKKSIDSAKACGMRETETCTKTTEYGSFACNIEPGSRLYVGGRYVWKFADPLEWNKRAAYEVFTVVQHEGFSYVSKKAVPANIDISNGDFWLLIADPNAQMEELRQTFESSVAEITSEFDEFKNETNTDIEQFKTDTNEDISQFKTDVENTFNETVGEWDDLIEEAARNSRAAMREKLTGGIIGHRGVSGSAPDNTLIGFQLAAKWGYTAVELDVQITSDRQYIIHHGVNTSETCDVQMDIRETPLATLKGLPITKGNNVECFKPQYMPTLEEALNMLNSYSVVPVLELKTESFNTKEAVQGMLDIVKACGFEKRIVISSFSEVVLQMVRELSPYAYIAEIRNTFNNGHIQRAKEHNFDAFMVNMNDLTADGVKTIHNAGLQAFGWVPESAGQVNELLSMGVDGITINDITCFNRPSTTQFGPLTYSRGGIVNGVSTVSKHEYDAAINGAFTTFIWRVPLPADEYGNQSFIKRSGNNLRQVGTIPRAMKPGTVIKFDKNPYYDYGILCCNPSDVTISPDDSGSIVPDTEDKYYVVPVRDVNNTEETLVSITAYKRNLPTYNNEYMFDHAAEYVHILPALEIQFGEMTTNNYPGITDTSVMLNRVKSARTYLRKPGRPLKLAPRDDMRIGIHAYKGGARVFDSGWISASNKSSIEGYNVEADEYIIPGDYDSIGFVWSRTSGDIGVGNLYKCFTILKDDVYGLTLPS